MLLSLMLLKEKKLNIMVFFVIRLFILKYGKSHRYSKYAIIIDMDVIVCMEQ